MRGVLLSVAGADAVRDRGDVRLSVRSARRSARALEALAHHRRQHRLPRPEPRGDADSAAGDSLPLAPGRGLYRPSAAVARMDAGRGPAVAARALRARL